MKLCTVEGCGRKHLAKGYCNKHYSQVVRRGTGVLPEKPHVCQVAGCDNKTVAKGYCNKHYIQARKHGELVPELEKRRNEHGHQNTD